MVNYSVSHGNSRKVCVYVCVYVHVYMYMYDDPFLALSVILSLKDMY